MESFLRIANKGVACPDALILMGASESRHLGLIGQFGTGAKFSIALLLRNSLNPIFFCSKMRLNFGSKPKKVGSIDQMQVTVKYGGCDEHNQSLSRTEALSYTTSMGEMDWDDLKMAPREFVSNAIDGANRAGFSMNDVEVSITDSVRAKDGWTQVYIPLCEEIEEFYKSLGARFLHFNPVYGKAIANFAPALEQNMILPKISPDSKLVRIYKKGVLVAEQEGESAYDYNLAQLQLDESRNAKEYDVKSECAKAWATASKEEKEALLVNLRTKPQIWESSLDADYMKGEYGLYGDKEPHKKSWRDAIESVYGVKVLCTVPSLEEYAARKGHQTVLVTPQLQKIGHFAGATTQESVLTSTERKGRSICDASLEMLQAVDAWWDVIVKAGMNNGHDKPQVQAFQQIMDAGSQTHGESDWEAGVIYLHVELGGKGLLKCVLEELAHHCTHAYDGSRDLQDWAFRLATHVAF